MKKYFWLMAVVLVLAASVGYIVFSSSNTKAMQRNSSYIGTNYITNCPHYSKLMKGLVSPAILGVTAYNRKHLAIIMFLGIKGNPTIVGTYSSRDHNQIELKFLQQELLFVNQDNSPSAKFSANAEASYNYEDFSGGNNLYIELAIGEGEGKCVIKANLSLFKVGDAQVYPKGTSYYNELKTIFTTSKNSNIFVY
jgi:hypothetical protein